MISDRKIAVDELTFTANASGTYSAAATTTGLFLHMTGSNNYSFSSTPDGTADYYTAEILRTTDYYAFGMEMPGRSFVSEGDYRFGFNGQEKEKQITGTATHTSAEYWMYDTRLGRRWQLDPVNKHHLSLYSTFDCNPIYFSDPNGDDWYKDADGNLQWHDNAADQICTAPDPNSKDACKVWDRVGSVLTIDLINASTEFWTYEQFQSGNFNEEADFTNLGGNVGDIEWVDQNCIGEDGLYFPTPLTGGLRQRLTHYKELYYANAKVTCNNFYDIIMGQLLFGFGPENWFFDANHPVSACIRESYQVDQLVGDWKESYLDKGMNDPKDFEASGWQNAKLPLTSLSLFIAHSDEEGGFKTPEHFIGSCLINIRKPVLQNGGWMIQVEVFNVTSVGSGSGTNEKSYPRPENATNPQPYTNVSQYFTFYKWLCPPP